MLIEIVPEHEGNLAKYLADCCQAFPDRPAFSDSVTHLTYAEFGERVELVAGAMASRVGVVPGTRIGVMLPNISSFPVVTAANLRLGAVQVNINPQYSVRELRHQLVDSGASTIIASVSALPVIAQARTEQLQTIVLVDQGDDTSEYTGLSECVLHRLDDLVETRSWLPSGWPQAGPNDLAFLQYTGGTTGLSKGAMLSHGNILANIDQFRSILDMQVWDDEVRLLTAIPLYHIFALTVNFFAMVGLGAHNVLITDPRNMPDLIARWDRHRINFVTGVNTLFKGLSANPDFASIEFSPDLVALGGGAPVQKAVSDRWKDLTGRHIREGYGLSETSPILTCTPFSEERFLGSIGMAVPETEISIRDPDGAEVPIGEIGELCARGPQVMQGYWNRPDATDAVITDDGFFQTGDMARADEEGRYYIVDRQKDMILVSGFNVYPNEIEAIVTEIAGVVECACIGQDDPRTGEAVAIFIVRDDPQLNAETVQDYCRQNLAAYKIPRHVHFIEDMPKSAVGKILRRELRIQYTEPSSRTDGATA